MLAMKALNNKAFSVVEYTVLFVIIIGAFVVMRTHIQQKFFGMWGQSGQSVSFGRQYDPQKSIDCSFDQQSGLWYDHNCFLSLSNQQCAGGDATCEEGIITSGSCTTDSCNQAANMTS